MQIGKSITGKGAGAILDSSCTIVANTEYIPAVTNVQKCQELMTFQHECGYEVPKVPCHKAFEWAAGFDLPICHAQVAVPSPLCVHSIDVSCSHADEVKDSVVWIGERPRRIQGSGSTIEDDEDFIWLKLDFFANFIAHEKSLIYMECGHELEVSCGDLPKMLSSKCKRE